MRQQRNDEERLPERPAHKQSREAQKGEIMAQYPKRLTAQNKQEIIKRRGGDSDKSGKRGDLEIHHMDRNPNNNNPRNLRVLTKKEHKDLHANS